MCILFHSVFSVQTPVSYTDGSGCLHFQYSMVGLSCEWLYVYQLNDMSPTNTQIIWSHQGPAYIEWNIAEITTNLTNGVQVEFTYKALQI